MKSDEILNAIYGFVDRMTNPNNKIGAAFYGIVTIFLAWALARAVKLAIHRSLDRIQRTGADPTGIRFLGKLASMGIYLLAFMAYAHVIPALTTLGKSLLASLGVASVVVGLAAQSTLGNLIAGVSLVLYRPFKVGDRVQVNGPAGSENGIVLSIDLGYTTLVTADKRKLVIPNSTMANQTSINLTAIPYAVSCGITVYVATGSDAAKARELLLEIAKSHPKIASVDGCFVTRVTSRGILVTLAASCANADFVPGIKSDLLDAARAKFEASGIKLV